MGQARRGRQGRREAGSRWILREAWRLVGGARSSVGLRKGCPEGEPNPCQGQGTQSAGAPAARGRQEADAPGFGPGHGGMLAVLEEPVRPAVNPAAVSVFT